MTLPYVHKESDHHESHNKSRNAYIVHLSLRKLGHSVFSSGYGLCSYININGILSRLMVNWDMNYINRIDWWNLCRSTEANRLQTCTVFMTTT